MQPHTALVLDDNDDAGRICELGLSHIGYDDLFYHIDTGKVSLHRT